MIYPGQSDGLVGDGANDKKLNVLTEKSILGCEISQMIMLLTCSSGGSSMWLLLVAGGLQCVDFPLRDGMLVLQIFIEMWDVNVFNGDWEIFNWIYLDGVLEVGNGWKCDHFLKSEYLLCALHLTLGKSKFVTFNCFY